MSKKKNRSRNNDADYGGSGMYNQERNDQIADHLEAYVDAISTLFILEGKKEEDVNDAVKKVRKAVKDLREGRPEKVFDIERYEEYALSED